MRRLSALISIAAGVALAFAAGGPAETAQRGPERGAAIDGVLQRAVEQRTVPGVVAIAADRRGVIYSGAAGVASAQPARPMTVDAIFRIASMTKAVTSVALLQLVDEKKVALDDPASKYLPAFAKLSVITSFDAKTGAYAVKPAARPITVRHLLTHTSGLGYSFTSPIVRDFKPRNGDTFESDRSCSSRAPTGSTARPPTGWDGSSKRSRARTSTRTSASASSRRSACATRISTCPRRRSRAWFRPGGARRTAR